MAVSKRTRFEVLRRDNYTCRYCRSTDGTLTIDHVTPVALGGSDQPSNLVAACKDCNAGKSSTSPDAATLASLSDAEIAYERARSKVLARIAERADQVTEDHDRFEESWTKLSGNRADLPDDWHYSVTQWVGRGLPVGRLCDAVAIAWRRDGVPPWAKFNYMAKIAWNWIGDIEQESSAELSLSDDETDPFDPLRILDMHIDGCSDLLPPSIRFVQEAA